MTEASRGQILRTSTCFRQISRIEIWTLFTTSSNARNDGWIRLSAHWQDEYDLIIFDCPPSINVLAENIFYAADCILVPLIPTTLSERTHRQLLTFFKKNDYDRRKIYTFVSMLDRRRKLHRELSDSFTTEFDQVLETAIPYSSDVEKMGIERQPVVAFAPRSKATEAYKQLWAEVYQELLNGKRGG